MNKSCVRPSISSPCKNLRLLKKKTHESTRLLYSYCQNLRLLKMSKHKNPRDCPCQHFRLLREHDEGTHINLLTSTSKKIKQLTIKHARTIKHAITKIQSMENPKTKQNIYLKGKYDCKSYLLSREKEYSS